MTEIEQAGPGTMIVVRPTGEVIDPADPDACLVALGRVRELQAQLAEAKRALDAALVRNALDRGERTVRTPDGRKYERTGGPEKRYDAHAIRRGLLEAGMPKDRVDEIVVSTVEWKVNGTEANKAAKANPDYRAVIEAGTSIVDKPYSVRST